MLCPTLNTCLAFTFFLFVCLNTSYCQQEYFDTKGLTCSTANFTPRAYLCNGPQSCMSFVSFRANPPYDSAANISSLFDSDSSNVVLFNKLSSINAKIPINQLVKVPVSCSCSGSLYQHSTPYTVLAGDTYDSISRTTFQGLTRCQYLDGQNYYLPTNLTAGVEVVVPIQCACPTANQTTQGIIALLTYVPAEGETLHEIGGNFSVTVESIMKANMISANTTIYPDLPVLIPLASQSCKENPDIFYCYCSKGYILDGNTNRFRCVHDNKRFPTKSVAIIGLSTVLGFLCFSIVTFQSHKYLRKRRERIRKGKLFEQNGGLLLEQKCSTYGSNESSKIFSAEELQRATDNFNKSRFLGQGGFGSVYKGMLPDGTIVAVKRSKAIDKTRIERFINEIVILSQINHRNIVKLLGCCLEIESPLLVYEYISNGTLSHHIHSQDPEYFLSWEDRLRIACEVAGAVAYMHSAASTPIFHRDIKPSNILLDEKRNSKVSDFGTSRLLPYNKTHLTTVVQGTFGYMDPEYLQSSHFTDKSDVYSFGVVLVELLTSKKPISFSGNEDEGGLNLVANFISLVKENSVLGIIDNRMAMEAKEEELLAVAMLAKRCLRLNNKKRPTMKEVAMELEGLKRSEICLEIQQSQPLNYNDDERSLLQRETPSCTMSFSGSFIGR